MQFYRINNANVYGILIFQSSQTVGLEPNLSDQDLDEDLLILPDDMPEGMTDFNDIFSWHEGETGQGGRSPGSPSGRNGCRSQPASPTQQGGPVPIIRSPFSNHNTNSRVSIFLVFVEYNHQSNIFP